jgi:hypothetical protein
VDTGFQWSQAALHDIRVGSTSVTLVTDVNALPFDPSLQLANWGLRVFLYEHT